MSEWVETNLPCPDQTECGSSDAYSINDKGWGKCFSCDRSFKVGEDGEASPGKKKTPKGLIYNGEAEALVKRCVSEETCAKFGYKRGQINGETAQFAPYHDGKGNLIATKVRFKDKGFTTTGDFKNVTLFGQHLWKSGGKRLVITEGEIDALSYAEVTGRTWPVVSVPNGASAAKKSIKAQIEWIESFEDVVFWFDNDEPGQEAAKECAVLLSPGKSRIGFAPSQWKDANDMLQDGEVQEMKRVVYNAPTYRPDGIVCIEDLFEAAAEPIQIGYPWWDGRLTDVTFGRREGEIYAFGAGTGVGKTDWMTQQAVFDATILGLKVGMIYLEMPPVELTRRVTGKAAQRVYHIPGVQFDREERKAAEEKLRGKVRIYDHWGETEWDVIASRIRYMVQAEDIKMIYLDHLTALADPANERESLEKIMKRIASLAQELGCIIHFVSHLATPDGKPHEEGGRVTIRHFKGSRAIGFWSFFMFGLERDQQAEDPEDAQTTTFRILKDRYTGQSTGKTFLLGYDHERGLLIPRDATSETWDDDDRPDY